MLTFSVHPYHDQEVFRQLILQLDSSVGTGRQNPQMLSQKTHLAHVTFVTHISFTQNQEACSFRHPLTCPPWQLCSNQSLLNCDPNCKNPA